jgi:transposase-like protein
MPKRMCPFCNSTDVSPDSMGGDIMSWTCKSCGNSFPAPLEAKGGKCGPNGEDSEYEEMPE